MGVLILMAHPVHHKTLSTVSFTLHPIRYSNGSDPTKTHKYRRVFFFHTARLLDLADFIFTFCFFRHTRNSLPAVTPKFG